MRAVLVRCPNCNANLQVESTVVSTTCQYCGTVSRIQARTAMFQIPKAPAMPKQPATMTNAERIAQLQQLAKMPVAVQKASLFLILLPFIMMAVIGGGVFIAIKKAGGIAGIGGSSFNVAGHPPALSDIDGDGTPDFVSMIRYVMNNDSAHFIAVSGKTGSTLWESATIGKYSDLTQDQYGAVGDTLYITTKDGKLIARNLKSQGVVKWELSLGEKIDTMCSLGNEVSIATADGKWWIVDGAGKKREGKKLYRLTRDYTNDEAKFAFERAGGEAGDVCIPLGWDHRTPPGVIALPSWSDVANIEGMRIEILMKRAGGPTIVYGKKQPGTSVPLLARLGPRPPEQPMPKKGWRTEEEKKALLPGAVWKVEIPSADPLNARMDEEHATLSDKAVFVLYEISNSKHHLAAFSIADGKRLWDRELQHGSSYNPISLTLSGDVVAITTWQSLTAYNVNDGNEVWKLGKDNW